MSLNSIHTFYLGDELQAVRYRMTVRDKSMGTQCRQVHMCSEAQNEDVTRKG